MAIFFTLWQQHILIRDLPSKMVYFEMTKDFKSENVGNNFFLRTKDKLCGRGHVDSSL